MSWKSEKTKHVVIDAPPMLKEAAPAPTPEEWTADVEVDGGHVHVTKRFDSEAAAVAYAKLVMAEGVQVESVNSSQFYAPARVGGVFVTLKPVAALGGES